MQWGVSTVNVTSRVQPRNKIEYGSLNIPKKMPAYEFVTLGWINMFIPIRFIKTRWGMWDIGRIRNCEKVNLYSLSSH